MYTSMYMYICVSHYCCFWTRSVSKCFYSLVLLCIPDAMYVYGIHGAYFSICPIRWCVLVPYTCAQSLSYFEVVTELTAVTATYMYVHVRRLNSAMLSSQCIRHCTHIRSCYGGSTCKQEGVDPVCCLCSRSPLIRQKWKETARLVAIA